MVAHGDRAEVTAGKGTGWATVEVTAGKEVSMGCQGGRRGVCGNADMECGVSVGLSGWNRGPPLGAGEGGGVSMEELECKEGFHGSGGGEEGVPVWKLGSAWGCQ